MSNIVDPGPILCSILHLSLKYKETLTLSMLGKIFFSAADVWKYMDRNILRHTAIIYFPDVTFFRGD